MAKSKFKRFKQKIARDIVYYAIRVLLPIAQAIPFKLAVGFGAFAGRIAWYITAFERRIARENLAIAFPEKTAAERDKIARDCFANLGRCFFEIVQFDKVRNRIDDFVECDEETWGHIIKARDIGKGTIILGGHLGNWELMANYGPLKGLSGTAIVKEVYDPRIDALQIEFRKKSNLGMIHRDDPMINMKIAQIVQRNDFLGILIDQDTKVRGVWADFFGKQAFTPSGPAFLSIQFGVTILPAHMYRLPGGRQKLETYPPYTCESTGDLKADIQRETEKMNGILTDWIRRHPTEWVWMHRRYKTKPPASE